jgi:hypothetical protein
MSRIAKFSAVLVTAAFIAQSAALAQGLEVKRYNPSEWTKGRFSEVVTVNGPGKTIYLAGVGAEDETGPAGASAPIRHLGNPTSSAATPTTRSSACWRRTARPLPTR